MRLLFVSPADLAAPRGGRAQLSRLHHDALAALLGDGYAAHRLDASPATILRRVTGHLDGVTPAGVDAALAAIDAHGAEAVWLDGSNLGRLAQAVRRHRSRVRILTFCHNVETRFFLGAVRRRPAVRAAGVLVGNYVAERLAVRSSDDLVALSERDAALFGRWYGRRADWLLPMAVADRLGVMSPDPTPVPDDAPLLFVGGAFYANQAGIAWFARHVAPRLDGHVQVVGQGMDAMRAELEAAGNVEVIGAVEALAPYYHTARAAIAPIFDGSGMKTKVAEALMFGKPVIGSSEAWSGYEAVEREAGWRCDTADAFVAAARAARGRPVKAFDTSLRRLYERDHSAAATRRRLAAILGVAEPAGMNRAI